MFIPADLVNEHFDDRYFDVVNAMDEAQQIYFRYNSLIDRITGAAGMNTAFTIGETGFGVGRVVVSLMEFLKNNGLRNVSIEYYSVELYPLNPVRMRNILEIFKERAGDEIDVLMKAYEGIDINENGWHSINLQQSFGTIELKLWIGEALEMVEALDKSCDVWFLDGHGPKKNPSIWRPELLKAIGEKTKDGGSFSTFTVAGAVKSALTDAGFIIDKLPGCGGKKEVLHGVKESILLI